MQAKHVRRFIAPVVASFLATTASGQEEPLHPPLEQQAFSLDPEDGCFRYSGTAFDFVGRFRAGAYVSVTMDNPERFPAMDAPEYKAPGSASWFGPLPESRNYGITFTPSYLHGSSDRVEICGRMSPPT
ncbi:hypothetical protein SAMN05892877_14123 [Rhizobium subbaraonis]|uniref:Uncharacterized protein n=1 Tax=Rhizobium subbaraonis TaxID=908946 RepID=A0A285V298_9HYPH|nr:hypothetical protein [Rhizobium subbaraonis]SOC48179.1 hypothetical protein SAMN05892877_14123 [Rhizobium subbaraonis]